MKQLPLKGFTLIELLVVIAIIGVLSAVVLASLNTARSKGNDAAIQSNLSTVRVQAELYYSNSNNYGTVFPTSSSCITASTMFMTDSVIKNAIDSAEKINGSGAMVCNASADAYAVSSPLTFGTTPGYWCIDSMGFGGKRATALGTGTVCPAT